MLERRTGRRRRRGVEPDKGKNGSPTILPKLMCVCRMVMRRGRSGTTTMKGTVFVGGGAQEMDGRIKASSCLLRSVG